MKNIELQLKPGTTLSSLGVSTLTTDHVRLGQVVTNLVSNAIRFTAGSPHRLITVTYDVARTKPEQDTCGLPDEQDNSSGPAATGSPVWLFVSVKDTGPGLSPEELKRLFLRFSRTSKFRSKSSLTISEASDMIHSQYGGSGLGLYICKSTYNSRCQFADLGRDNGTT
jgi:signal transduction histidine kinase